MCVDGTKRDQEHGKQPENLLSQTNRTLVRVWGYTQYGRALLPPANGGSINRTAAGARLAFGAY